MFFRLNVKVVVWNNIIGDFLDSLGTYHKNRHFSTIKFVKFQRAAEK